MFSDLSMCSQQNLNGFLGMDRGRLEKRKTSHTLYTSSTDWNIMYKDGFTIEELVEASHSIVDTTKKGFVDQISKLGKNTKNSSIINFKESAPGEVPQGEKLCRSWKHKNSHRVLSC